MLRFVLTIIAVAVAFPVFGAPPVTPDNPRPTDGDFVLPMPGGVEMVFRPVLVPGESFWGGKERIIQLGDPDGGMFEGLQRVQVSGSFPAPDGETWVYYLGKYEVTKRQFAALLGMDALVNESANPKDEQLAKLDGQRLQAALSEPLSAVAWSAVQSIVHAYNRWLFDSDHPERLDPLPKLDGVPGYLRLPTEVEWEYAARGGEAALDAGTFGDKLPVSLASLNTHAWHRGNAKAKVRPVGLREPNQLGIHDMLGNVQELASQRFLPEIWQGKPGGMVARGGSVLTSPKELRSSSRAEVGIYRWNPDRGRMEEQRSFTTGVRLAIGSDVIVSPKYWEELQGGYQAYKASTRGNTPVGLTLEHPISQGASAVGLAHESLDALMAKNQDLATELAEVKSYIEQAEQKMDEAQQEGARSLAQDALRNAANAASYIFRVRRLNDKAEELKALAEELSSEKLRGQADLLTKKAKKSGSLAGEQLDGYARRVGQLGEYGDAYVEKALVTMGKQRLSPREKTGLVLLSGHVKVYRAGRRILREEWGDDFEKHFFSIGK